MRDIPFELLYGLYRDRSIETLAYTLLASLIANQLVKIVNDQIVFVSTSLPQPVKKFFKHFKVNTTNSVSWDKVEELTDYLFGSLTKRKFLVKVPILGIFKTKEYRKYIRENIGEARSDLLSYVSSGKREFLDTIDKRLRKTAFAFQEPEGFYSYYKDRADAWSNAISTTVGIVDVNRYRYYYTRAGDRRKTK
jgi:hypothetical protein